MKVKPNVQATIGELELLAAASQLAHYLVRTGLVREVTIIPPVTIRR